MPCTKNHFMVHLNLRLLCSHRMNAGHINVVLYSQQATLTFGKIMIMCVCVHVCFCVLLLLLLRSGDDHGNLLSKALLHGNSILAKWYWRNLLSVISRC